MKSLEELFSPEGALAGAIPGYRKRPEQVEMAQVDDFQGVLRNRRECDQQRNSKSDHGAAIHLSS